MGGLFGAGGAAGVAIWLNQRREFERLKSIKKNVQRATIMFVSALRRYEAAVKNQADTPLAEVRDSVRLVNEAVVAYMVEFPMYVEKSRHEVLQALKQIDESLGALKFGGLLDILSECSKAGKAATRLLDTVQGLD